MKEFAIVVIGYNRPNSMKRLLNVLQKCNYFNDVVDLIISIDNSGSNEVQEVADGIDWPYGDKFIKTYAERQGLKSHILACGNYTNEYKCIAMFEDDIIPSFHFYQYAKEAVEFFDADERIAGVSLYQHLWNVGNDYNFIPDVSPNYDNYFMQYAQSWGQVWTTRMWSEFINWYVENNDEFMKDVYLPENVASWPETSWLKYFIKYVIYTDKYFVYPKIALATNFAEVGQNNSFQTSHYQVPILNEQVEKFHFQSLDKSQCTYDAFFERNEIAEFLVIPRDELCIDLNGMKENKMKKRYWLTLDEENYKVVKSFSYSMKPQEINIKYDIHGKDIFLYDTTIPIKKVKNNDTVLKQILYSSRDMRLQQSLKLTHYLLKNTLKRRFKRIKKLFSR